MSNKNNTIPTRWLLRADSRPHVGAGHITRCLALGQALAEALRQQAKVQVTMDAGSENWGKKFSQLDISRNYCRSLEEMPQGTPPWDGIIIDGYDFSPAYFERLAEMTPRLVVIDDFMSPPACAALALNPTVGLKGNRIEGVPALMGEKFALIDPAYRHVKIHEVRESVRHVVISCGMGDPARSNELVVEALDLLYPDYPNLSVSVAVGAQVPHLRDLEALARQAGIPVKIKIDVTDMISLFSSADLVIGAGGVSLLERMACGLPSASLVIADNQRAAIHGAAKAGATMDLGEDAHLTPAILAEKLRPLLEHQSLRHKMARQGRKTVDGRGADRAGAALLALAGRQPLPNSTSRKDG
jgi:UDP-2,4-diacetamido-2,4,6-trideoxy-beta-L-altropyranose hydrolase